MISRPSLLACHACRRKHLKCDAETPICGRCLTNSLECFYPGSRRGLHKRKGNGNPLKSSNHPPYSATSGLLPANSTTPPANYVTPSPNVNHAPSVNPHASTFREPSLDWQFDESTHERLLGLFYTKFYDAHPFLVPRTFYAAQLYPRYLDLVVCFIGQHYSEDVAQATTLSNAISTAMVEPDELTVHRVQALLLYAIALHARNQIKEAESLLERAVRMAFDMGMNEASFAANSGTSFVVEESFRRTWWELYTVDIYLAAVLRRSPFCGHGIRTLPLLPSCQSVFDSGIRVAESPSLQAFEDRVFEPEPRLDFCSYCYRIDAIRIVGRVLALTTVQEADPDSIQAVDNALVSWQYNLPTSRSNIVGASGEVDEMLFQARCFIACANVFLHFPRSDLPTKVPSPLNDLACIRSYTQLAPTSRHHGIKCINASKQLSDLLTLPWPLERHSPLFICGIVLGCIIQLAVGTTHLNQCALDCLQQHRERVVLMLGALQQLGERWSLAQHALGYLRSIAAMILTARDGAEHDVSAGSNDHDSGMGLSEDLGDINWLDLLAVDQFPSNMFNNGEM